MSRELTLEDIKKCIEIMEDNKMTEEEIQAKLRKSIEESLSEE